MGSLSLSICFSHRPRAPLFVAQPSLSGGSACEPFFAVCTSLCILGARRFELSSILVFGEEKMSLAADYGSREQA